jgi:hypothetical protein
LIATFSPKKLKEKIKRRKIIKFIKERIIWLVFKFLLKKVQKETHFEFGTFLLRFAFNRKPRMGK